MVKSEVKIMKRFKTVAVLLVMGLLTFGVAANADTSSDARLQDKLAGEFSHNKALKDVRAAVNDGAVTLQGSVPLYRDKLNAETKARKVAKVSTVRNLVKVAGPEVPDTELAKKLASSLRYERVGYGNLFNALSLAVNHGIVTLNGEVRTPADQAAYLDLVQRTPGVKGVVNNVRVAPVSTFDDGLRIRLARAIYGDSMLSKYAMDPAAPIRIVVDNGHVTLYGAVDNNVDRQVAEMRARQVFGAFSVENRLVTPSDHVR